MEPIRLNARDRLLLLALGLIFLGGLAVGLLWFDDTFPEATIDFRYDRKGSEQLALDHLEGLDLAPDAGMKHASAFDYSGLAKTYLEKELGLETMQSLVGDPVQLWYWGHRWFRPGEKEAYRVHVSPAGELVGLWHLVEQEAPGDSLERDHAIALAQRLLSTLAEVDSSALVLQGATASPRQARKDWEITWRLRDFEPAPGAEYRYSVGLNGSELGSFRQGLHVPESWRGEYKRLRSRNQLAGSIASLLMILTAIAVVIVFFIKVRHHNIRWRTAVGFGIVATVLVYANQLNNLPLTLYGYDTTTSWGSFLLNQLLVGLLQAIGVGVLIAVLTASAEAIFRERYPALPALPTMFTLRGLRTKSAFLNIAVGITMTSFFFAYQVIFYRVSSSFGAWSPADVPYNNLLNTAMPFLAVLLIGFMPAVSEEFLSRMFSIPFLHKLMRGRLLWLAVLLPAFIWGFGHATYPNEPFWIRGVEVGVAGIIVGVIMLRFGILAPLVWHYTVDALYTAFLLFDSGNLYFILTASVAAGLLVIPLLIAFIAYLRSGTFAPEAGTRNGDLPEDETAGQSAAATREEFTRTQDPPEQETLRYRGLPTWLRISVPLLLLLGLAAGWQAERPGDFMAWSVSAEKAEARFADSLRARGWADPDTLFLGAFSSQRTPQRAGWIRYSFKQLGSVPALNERLDSLHRLGRWQLLAYRPGNRTHFSALVDGRDGELRNLRLWLAEERPGDSLSLDSASALARTALGRAGLDTSLLQQNEVLEQSRPRRKDYNFFYAYPEDDPRAIGEANLRHLVQVQGSEVTVTEIPSLKLPENWQREQQQRTVPRSLLGIGRIAVLALLLGYGTVFFVLRVRADKVRMKRAWLHALLPGLLGLGALPSMLYSLREAHLQAAVEVEWLVFLGMASIGLVLSVAVGYLLYALALALLDTLYPDAARRLQPAARRSGTLDSLLAALGAAALLLLLAALRAGLTELAGATAVLQSLPGSELLGSLLPAGGLLQNWINSFFLAAGLLALLAHLWTRVLTRPWMRGLLLAGLLLLGARGPAVGAGEALFLTALSAAQIVAGWLALKLLVRGEPLRLLAVAASFAWMTQLLPALSLDNEQLSLSALAVSLLLLLAWIAWLRLPLGQRGSKSA